MARKQFTMTQFQHEELMARYKNAVETKQLALVDKAWDDLGDEMGFYGDTARCILGDPLQFTAIAKTQ